jgi:hypothetical protein
MAFKPRSVRCKNCGSKFEKTRPWMLFCTEKCRRESHRTGAVPVKEIERLVKKFVLRWTDAIIDREIKKAKAKLKEEVRAELLTELITNLEQREIDREQREIDRHFSKDGKMYFQDPLDNPDLVWRDTGQDSVAERADTPVQRETK